MYVGGFPLSLCILFTDTGRGESRFLVPDPSARQPHSRARLREEQSRWWLCLVATESTVTTAATTAAAAALLPRRLHYTRGGVEFD